MDLSKLKVPDLKKELKSRGLSVSGNKVELMERLQTALKSKQDDTASAESVEDLDEDLLNEEDDEHIDGTGSEINDLDLPVEPTTPIQKGIKRKSSENLPTNEPSKQPKKIILHRNISSTEEKKENEVEETNSAEKTEEKKIIKFSELSAKERLEMRAKKFGVPIPGDAKKVARAERFSNTTTTTKSTGSVSISACAAPTVDVLKQRAERFGVTVSTALSKLENQARLDKRKERFSVVNGNTQPDKAQQRLERFKQPV